MRPIIGVTPLYDTGKESVWMLPGYLTGIQLAGGLPLTLPRECSEEEIDRILDLCDGFLFTGGHDVNPGLYGAERLPLCGETEDARDLLETRLFTRAYEEDAPILGICRGIQLFNAILGGTLYQDIPTEHPSQICHQMRPPYDVSVHEVTLTADGPLAALFGKERLGVNSYHHQGVKTVAPALSISARADDGIVEGVYAADKWYVQAIQWHPEFCAYEGHEQMKIFQDLIDHCK